MPTSPRLKQNGNIHPKPKPPTVGANTVRPQRARCEPYPPIQRREMIFLTAAAASPSPNGNGDGRLTQGWRAACSPLRGIYVFRYAIILPLRKTLRRGRCPHRPAPNKTVISIPNRQPHRRGEHRSPEPPLLEEVPVRAEESLVPLKRGMFDRTEGFRRGRCPHRPAQLFARCYPYTPGNTALGKTL